MAKLKKAAQVCEIVLLLAGIAVLCGTEGLLPNKTRGQREDTGNDQDDLSAWGIGS
jgi:hypothetical protein